MLFLGIKNDCEMGAHNRYVFHLLQLLGVVVVSYTNIFCIIQILSIGLGLVQFIDIAE